MFVLHKEAKKERLRDRKGRKGRKGAMETETRAGKAIEIYAGREVEKG